MQVRPAAAEKPEKIRLAVEFVDHAACAHIAANQGWYGRAGLNVEIHDTFVTGMALGAALCRGDIDAAFMPEQFPTMAEDSGFKQLVSAADLWPGMQGSVLVVTEGFLQSRPDAVRKLVELTESGIEFIDENPGLAAEIVSSQLNAAGKKVFPESLSQDGQNLAISPSVIRRSLGKKLENTWKISPSAVQEAIDEAAKLGYIRKSFAAGEMLDLRFLNQ
jgi:NitT/TauT family transport system substrate-binding protein